MQEKISPKLPHACGPLWAAGHAEGVFHHPLPEQGADPRAGDLPAQAYGMSLLEPGSSWPEVVDKVGQCCVSPQTPVGLELITWWTGWPARASHELKAVTP